MQRTGIDCVSNDPESFGPVAHLGERRTCNAEAVGAEPTRSTKFERYQWGNSSNDPSAFDLSEDLKQTCSIEID